MMRYVYIEEPRVLLCYTYLAQGKTEHSHQISCYDSSPKQLPYCVHLSPQLSRKIQALHEMHRAVVTVRLTTSGSPTVRYLKKFSLLSAYFVESIALSVDCLNDECLQLTYPSQALTVTR